MKSKLRTVGCFVEYGDKFILLLRNSTKPQGNTWGLPAGKVENNESDLETIVRETYEETGIKLPQSKFELIGVYEFNFSYLDLTFPTYRVKLGKDHKVVIRTNEHKAYKWVTAEECFAMNHLIDGLQDLLKWTGYVNDIKEIGLARGMVKLVPYNPIWKNLFKGEAKLLGNTLGIDLDTIQHVGSTSIPGILAKPIIDIAIPVDDLEIAEKWVKPLSEVGYWYKGKQTNMPDRRFFAKGPEDNRTIYLHIVNRNEYNRMIKFRDALIGDVALANEYSNLKKQLTESLSKNREKYTSSKNDFIQKIL
jgi:GrpB-like predicted nucleotidyltransferase (UPF0157 family)/8-oxo-dGTP pyrophosphatase MutT (NUDIX family)